MNSTMYTPGENTGEKLDDGDSSYMEHLLTDIFAKAAAEVCDRTMKGSEFVSFARDLQQAAVSTGHITEDRVTAACSKALDELIGLTAFNQIKREQLVFLAEQAFAIDNVG